MNDKSGAVAPSIAAIAMLSDNYGWLIRNDATAAVVDPSDPRPVTRRLQQEGLDLSAILITHHHRDHCQGVAELKARWNCPVMGPDDRRLTVADAPCRGGESRTVLSLPVQILDAPGHTKSHLIYYFPSLKALFTGDTLFSAGCGRIFEGTPAQMLQSLRKCASFADDTLIYCGHEYTRENLSFAAIIEPHNAAIRKRLEEVIDLRARGLPSVPSKLLVEKATNPFLRCGEESVRKFLHMENATEDEVFSELRSRKDRF